MRAKAEGIRNLFVFCNHVTIIPPMKADPRLAGSAARRLPRPRTCFDRGWYPPLRVRSPTRTTSRWSWSVSSARHPPGRAHDHPAIHEGRCEVENQYKRVVHDDGNPRRSRFLLGVSSCGPTSSGAGSGSSARGARAQDEFADFDAGRCSPCPAFVSRDPKACQCGEVLKGVLKPWNARSSARMHAGDAHPVPAMGSSEGACAAYYNFGRYSRAGVSASACSRRASTRTARERPG